MPNLQGSMQIKSSIKIKDWLKNMLSEEEIREGRKRINDYYPIRDKTFFELFPLLTPFKGLVKTNKLLDLPEELNPKSVVVIYKTESGEEKEMKLHT